MCATHAAETLRRVKNSRHEVINNSLCVLSDRLDSLGDRFSNHLGRHRVLACSCCSTQGPQLHPLFHLQSDLFPARAAHRLPGTRSQSARVLIRTPLTRFACRSPQAARGEGQGWRAELARAPFVRGEGIGETGGQPTCRLSFSPEVREQVGEQRSCLRVVERGGKVGLVLSLHLDRKRTRRRPIVAKRPNADQSCRLQPCLCFDASGLDGGAQRGVVEFVLVGVELGEVGECLVHGVV